MSSKGNKLRFKPRRPFNMAETFYYKKAPKRDNDTQLELLMRRRIDKATRAAFPDQKERQKYIHALMDGLENEPHILPTKEFYQ